MYRQRELFLHNLIASSVETIRSSVPEDGYYLCFSGGKDSVVLKHLCDIAGVEYEAHFHRTTIDPPEVIRFIKQHHQDVILDRPSTSMFKLIVEQGCPPTRLIRYCCRIFKEPYGSGRVVLTGIRRSESGPRKAKKLVEQCPAMAKVMIHPMLEWLDSEIWDFIYTESLDYCELYDEGYQRIGCILCPFSPCRERRLVEDRWPRFYKAYMDCFKKMLQERDRKGKTTTWKNAQEVMDWWISK